MPTYLQVLTALPTRPDADRIAHLVVEKRLAACAQVIGPISSTYWWQGKLETAEEWLCLIKSEIAVYAELEQAIRDAHPYQVPEVLAVPIAAGSADYLAWLSGEIRPAS